MVGWAITFFSVACACLLFRMVKRKGTGEFPLFDANFGEVAVVAGEFCVFIEDEFAVEYCCQQRAHASLEEARTCWQRWQHFINLQPARCRECGSIIDVTPNNPCLQCAVNQQR